MVVGAVRASVTRASLAANVDIDIIVVIVYIVAHDYFQWTASDLPDLTGRTVDRHRRQQRHRPRRRARARPAPAPTSCSPCATPPRASAAAATIAGATEVRRARPRRPRVGARVRRRLGRRPRRADQQRRRHGAAASAHRRRLRAAVRHQPPRPLRADQPAAAAHHRPRRHRLLDGAHRIGTIDLDDLNWERRRYQRWRAYGQSKLANLLFTLELQRRLDDAGSDVRAIAAHPGYAATNLQFHTGRTSSRHASWRIGNRRARPERGDGRAADALRRDARTSPATATSGPDGFSEQRGHPKLVGPQRRRARTPTTARRLWERLRGADRRALPARPGGRLSQRPRVFPRRRAAP